MFIFQYSDSSHHFRSEGFLASREIKEEPPEDSNVRLWFLGKTIEMLAQADLVVFAEDWPKARGCRIEHECAKIYHIPMVTITGGEELEIEE